MKQIMLTIFIALGVIVLFTSCSSTWSGVKNDTSNVWNTTKKVSMRQLNKIFSCFSYSSLKPKSSSSSLPF